MRTVTSLAAAAAALVAAPSLAAELVTNGAFSAGNTGFTSTYGPLGSPAALGSIAVTTNPNSLCGCFVSIGDHTTGTGNMLFVDGAEGNTGAFWSQTFAVAANSSYAFSFWASNAGTAGPLPLLRATANGTVLVANATLGPSTGNTATTWQQFTGLFESGAATSVTLSLFDDRQVYSYNDLVVDDISFTGPAAVGGAVPEPATWAMMIAGFGAVGAQLRRRAHRIAPAAIA